MFCRVAFQNEIYSTEKIIAFGHKDNKYANNYFSPCSAIRGRLNELINAPFYILFLFFILGAYAVSCSTVPFYAHVNALSSFHSMFSLLELYPRFFVCKTSVFFTSHLFCGNGRNNF